MRLNPTLIFGFSLACLLSVNQAVASNLSNGINFYKTKDYLMSSKLLEKAVAESPRNWRAHYYLANSQMALGRFNTATYHYELVRDLTQNRTILKNAAEAIVRMENLRVNSNIASVNKEHTRSSSSTNINHEAQLNQHKQQILAEAEARAKAIEIAADRQIKAEKANSNYWTITPQGEQVMTIPWQREESIREEAANAAAHIRQTAQRSADNVY